MQRSMTSGIGLDEFKDYAIVGIARAERPCQSLTA